MNIIGAPLNFSGFAGAPITAIERKLSMLRNWEEEAAVFMGRCATFFRGVGEYGRQLSPMAVAAG